MTEPTDDETTYTITKLQTANVLNLSVVEITPKGNVVKIGGKNGAGKSSIFNSIRYALGGTKSIPPKPLRTGARRGKTIVTFSDGTRVVRGYKPRKGSLEVSSTLEVIDPEGNTVPSPQKWLRGIVGELSFDPMEYSRMKPADQAAILRKLVGADTTEIDDERKRIYDERTGAGRDVKRLEARVEGIAHDPGAPAEPVSVQALAEELERATATSSANAEARREASELKGAATRERDKQTAISEAYDRQRNEIKELEKRLDGLREDLQATGDRRNEEDKRVSVLENAAGASVSQAAALTDPDTTEIRLKLSEADATNQRVRKNQERAKALAELRTAEKLHEKLSDRIDGCDERKDKLLANVEYPIDGLGFGAGCVTFEELPLEQANKTTRLRISVALGIALNARLRIMFIEDGSLFDDEGLGMMACMAAEADMQVWLEIVTADPNECQIFIEDGHVAEVA